MCAVAVGDCIIIIMKRVTSFFIEELVDFRSCQSNRFSFLCVNENVPWY
jgi:hypothetical protein